MRRTWWSAIESDAAECLKGSVQHVQLFAFVLERSTDFYVAVVTTRKANRQFESLVGL